MPAKYEIICVRGAIGGCGFRVHDRYFEAKPRFHPGVCPNCAGPLAVVHAASDTIVKTLRVSETGRVETVA